MRTMSLELLTTDEIYLSKEEYKATKSKIKFQLEPVDPNKWTQLRNIPLSIVSSFVRKNPSTIFMCRSSVIEIHEMTITRSNGRPRAVCV